MSATAGGAAGTLGAASAAQLPVRIPTAPNDDEQADEGDRAAHRRAAAPAAPHALFGAS